MTQQSWLLLFAFSPSGSFIAFLALFFSFVGHLVGFILVGKVFRNAFRILGFNENKGSLVVEQDFHGNFRVNVTWFFAFFSSVLDWIVLILVLFERSLHCAHVSGQSCPWPLKTDDVTSGRRDVDPHGRLRGALKRSPRIFGSLFF